MGRRLGVVHLGPPRHARRIAGSARRDTAVTIAVFRLPISGNPRLCRFTKLYTLIIIQTAPMWGHSEAINETVGNCVVSRGFYRSRV